MQIRIALHLLFLILTIPVTQAEEIHSFIEEENIALFIYEQFDLTTIRSSLGPSRTSGQSNFLKDYDFPKPIGTNSEFNIITDHWQYHFRVLGIKDYNDDGLKDIFVCFTDDSLHASYYSQQTILMTRYNERMPLIALDYQPYYAQCNEKDTPPSLDYIDRVLEEWRNQKQ